MPRKCHWTDDDVINMAITYLSDPTNSMLMTEKELGIPDTTICWCIKNRLKWIDGGLYLRCLHQISTHSKKSYTASS